jgi:hypothetical protein
MAGVYERVRKSGEPLLYYAIVSEFATHSHMLWAGYAPCEIGQCIEQLCWPSDVSCADRALCSLCHDRLVLFTVYRCQDLLLSLGAVHLCDEHVMLVSVPAVAPAAVPCVVVSAMVPRLMYCGLASNHMAASAKGCCISLLMLHLLGPCL